MASDAERRLERLKVKVQSAAKDKAAHEARIEMLKERRDELIERAEKAGVKPKKGQSWAEAVRLEAKKAEEEFEKALAEAEAMVEAVDP